jgi:flagellar motility protein MotE (MotC chaperone)
MKAIAKFLRPLPAVIVVGAVLLGVKGDGLIRAALGEAAADKLIADDTAPLPVDLATADEGPTAGQNDVMVGLSKRRIELDERSAAIDERANLVAAAEKRVEGKIATLKDLQGQIETLLGKRDEAEQKQLMSLVKTYSSMKPKDAARIFNTLSDDVLVPVAAAMKADVLGAIMAAMNSDTAEKLTVKLANRLKTPELAAPAAAAPDANLICSPLPDAGSSMPNLVPPAQTPAKRS